MLSVDIRLQRRDFMLQLQHRFADNKITAVFGASGSGKSTLLRCIAGLEARVTGEISWQGQPWQNKKTFRKAEQRNLAMVFQQANLFSKKRVIDNIRYGLPKTTDDIFIEPQEVIDLLQLQPLLQRLPSQLSGGQQQRVAIARALLSQPKLLLLDEPLNGLDSDAKRQILGDLKRIQQRYQLPMLLVSHHVDEVVSLADEVVVIDNGVKVSAGSLVDEAPYLGQVSDGPLSIIELTQTDKPVEQGLRCWSMGVQQLWLPDGLTKTLNQVDKHKRLVIWARDVSISLSPARDSSLSNQVDATITDIQSAGHEAEKIVTLLVDGQLLRALVTVVSCQRLKLGVGQKITAAFKAAAMH
ncbi:molybdate transport system ATP-binding protein [Idiomarina aquatica]|uniref:Molybdate transport system ATP-binding protein n=1 Tax=Idiomarina aquatica TaxID=1327752 RepID=A0A4R6P3L0_9GAMM|nr:molybdenum ABC transporter ATP-binding protein [Idiomarina aquatica]TDP32151.1 molybdate transport system ATP-binding protein [Idiomarina aquatica]